MRKIIRQMYSIAVDLLVLSSPLSIYRIIAPPFSKEIFEMYVTPAFYWTDLFSAIVILVGVGNIWIGEKRKFDLKPLWCHLIPISGIVVLSAISVFGSISQSLAGYYATRLFLNYILLLILVTNKFDFKRVAFIFTLSMVCQSIIGIAQFIHRGPIGLPGEMSLEIDQVGAARIAVSGRRWLRAYGLTFHPNVLGGFLVIGLILSLPLLKRVSARIIWFLVLAGVILSFSRSAWFAAGLVLPVLFAWLFFQHPEYRRPLVSISVGITLFGILGAIMVFGQIKTRLQPFQTFAEFTSLYERGQLIEIAFDVIAKDPLTGIGAGNFPLAVLSSQNSIRPHFVHNVPLLLASECGILAGILWYVLWLAPLVNLRQYWKKKALWPIVFGGGWFAVGMIGLWDSYPWNLESGRVLSIILLAGLYQSLILTGDNEKNN